MTFKHFCGALGLTTLVVFELAYRLAQRIDDRPKPAEPGRRPGDPAAARSAVCPHCGHVSNASRGC
jgi:hypothetical protein